MQLSFGKIVRAKIVALGFILLVTKLSNPTGSPGRCDFNIIHSSIWASWCLPRPNWRWHWWFLVVHPNWQKWFGNVKFSEWQLQTSEKHVALANFSWWTLRGWRKIPAVDSSDSCLGMNILFKKRDYGTASKAVRPSDFGWNFCLPQGFLLSERLLVSWTNHRTQRTCSSHTFKGFLSGLTWN